LKSNLQGPAGEKGGAKDADEKIESYKKKKPWAVFNSIERFGAQGEWTTKGKRKEGGGSKKGKGYGQGGKTGGVPKGKLQVRWGGCIGGKLKPNISPATKTGPVRKSINAALGKGAKGNAKTMRKGKVRGCERPGVTVPRSLRFGNS